MMGRIKCNVASCKYNEDGDLCKASEIMVKNNFGASDHMEFGVLDSKQDAKTSMQTCCETFAPKEDSAKS